MEPVTTAELVAEMERVLGPKRAGTAIGSALAQKLVDLAFAWADASPERRSSVLAHGKRDILEWHRRTVSTQQKTRLAKNYIPARSFGGRELVPAYYASEHHYVRVPVAATYVVRKTAAAKKLKGVPAKKVKAAKRRKATAKKKIKAIVKTRRKATPKKVARKRAVAKSTRKAVVRKPVRKSVRKASKRVVAKRLFAVLPRMPGRLSR